MKKIYIILFATCVAALSLGALVLGSGDYQGTESCKMCHTGALGSFPGYDAFSKTLHTTIHLVPNKDNMIGDFTKDVDMGASYANAKVGFRIDGEDYYIVFKPTSGATVEYQVVYTYGQNWKQRYLVKIEDSYYMPPVQWNLNGYKDNSSGKWVTYNPANWWNADGTLKPINNAFRIKSWDKNCAGCHVVPGKKENTIQKTINGADTAWVYTWANNNSHTNIVVGCESCHGYPTADMGKGHVNNLKNMSYDRKLEVCGQCHTRGYSNHDTYEYPYDENTGKTYPVGEDLMNYYILKPGLWPDKENSRQHHQQWVDYKLTKHYNAEVGITCVTCHDPHQNTAYNFQLKEDFRANETGKGCIKCHTDKTAEQNGINTHSKHASSATMCVSCHMTKSATTGKGYDISGHNFSVISPEKTILYKDVTTPAKGMPNTCALSCHRNGKGTFGSGKSFGITDANLGDWTEATDLALADSLFKYYKLMFPNTDVKEVYTFTSDTEIMNNYPNPFKDFTTIKLDVVRSGHIKLEVFNTNGELISILINKTMNAGSYTVDWNGVSADGYPMPSGAYFAVLYNQGKKVGTRKLLFNR